MVLEVDLTYKLAVVFAIDFSLELPREGRKGTGGRVAEGANLEDLLQVHHLSW